MAALIHFDCPAEECHCRRRCRAAPVDSPRGALLIGRGMGRNLSALLFFLSLIVSSVCIAIQMR